MKTRRMFVKSLAVCILACVGFAQSVVAVPNIPKPSASTGYSSYTKVTWSSVKGATSYRVYRSTSSSFSSASKIYTGSSRTFYDTSAKLGYKYYYWVMAKVNGSWWYNSSRYDTGWRYFLLTVKSVSKGKKVYLKMTVNGKYVTSPYTITWSGVHSYHKYLSNPYICYFTSTRRGKGTWKVKFGKTVTATVSGTINWR